MIKSQSHNSYIPILLFLFAALVWRSSYYIYTLYVAIPMIIIYSFYKYGKSIFTSKYFVPYLFIIVWMYLSSYVNPNTEQSLNLMIPTTAAFLFSFATYSIVYNNRHSKYIFLTYILLFAYLMGQNMLSDSFTMSFDYANEQERHNNSKLNANDYAYYSLFAIIAWRMFIVYLKNKIKGICLLSIYLISLGIIFFVALMTASRQVMALEIPLLLFFFYFDFIKGGKNKSILLLLTIAIIVVLPTVIDIYDGSYLAQRSEIGFKEDTRSDILWRSINQGIANPIFGLGLGANTFFSHNTYTHILARTGFPSFFAFLYVMLNCIIVQWRRFRKTKDTNFLIFGGCLGITAIGHFTFAYFSEPYMMAIIFAVIGISDKKYNDYILTRSLKLG